MNGFFLNLRHRLIKDLFDKILFKRKSHIFFTLFEFIRDCETMVWVWILLVAGNLSFTFQKIAAFLSNK